MSKFLRTDRPTLVAMLKATTTAELICEIGKILLQGTDAFGFQIDILKPEERKAENYKEIFAAMQGKPVYVTNYARGNAIDYTDEELTEQLYVAVECGAKLIDIRCDLFDRQPDEYSVDEKVIEKQKAVIKKIKEMGAEVLMSAHVLKYIPYEKTLEIARAQQERGADVVKIVTEANTEAELLDNYKTTILLKEQLDVPSLFLCNGKYCRKHRIIGPATVKGMFLVAENSNIIDQPTIKRAKEMLTLAGYDDLP